MIVTNLRDTSFFKCSLALYSVFEVKINAFNLSC